MVEAAVFREGWTLDDVQWSRFDASRVDPHMLAAIKAAALVEYAAPDYVVYLKRVFANADTATIESLERWGREEVQHGQALSRWAALADPSFDFKETFARFKAGYRPDHFNGDDLTSIRGSRRGEMIARCVVESGTSSYYSAIRDATDEPLLQEIAGRIAADEFRHYKLFYRDAERAGRTGSAILEEGAGCHRPDQRIRRRRAFLCLLLRHGARRARSRDALCARRLRQSLLPARAWGSIAVRTSRS